MLKGIPCGIDNKHASKCFANVIHGKPHALRPDNLSVPLGSFPLAHTQAYEVRSKEVGTPPVFFNPQFLTGVYR